MYFAQIKYQDQPAHNVQSGIRVKLGLTNCIEFIALLNPLPDNKILHWSKLKPNADNILTHSHTMTPFDAPGK